MLTKDLITEIAAQTGMTKRRTEELLNATTNVVVENLLQGKSVQLQGLGALEIKEKSARIVVHPRTGERTEVPAKQQLVLRPTAGIKELLNGTK
ncbi:MAG: HU family DNA-binding protein [Paludibacteraceae bacterium]|nr:HU family DNA-binding protein [Paludibacteraceae bacterium]